MSQLSRRSSSQIVARMRVTIAAVAIAAGGGCAPGSGAPTVETKVVYSDAFTIDTT